jgi:hypothetical protein
MKGNYGCPCSGCRGAGTIHQELKAKLCAIERLLVVETIITSGYRCPAHNAGVGGKEHSRHLGNPESTEEARLEAKESYAVDFWPLDRDVVALHEKWGNKRFDFHELVKPYFQYSYIAVNPNDHRRWAIHGQIK